MDIGEDAVTRWKACDERLFTPLAEPGATPGGGGAPAGGVAARMSMGHGGIGSGGSGPGGTASSSPLEGRYVDDDGNLLADPTKQPYGEFRMVPINLRVVIEQKEIPRLLARNAPTPPCPSTSVA